MEKVYNYYGDDVTNKKLRLADPSFGDYDSDMNPIPFWPVPNEDVDKFGFDKRHLNEEGLYKQEVVLPKGTRLCRYGEPQGRTTTNVGIPYELLGMPYDIETIQYHEYKVIADNVQVQLKVVKGFVYPAFKSKGNVIQYVHFTSIKEEIESGKIEEDLSWLKKRKTHV